MMRGSLACTLRSCKPLVPLGFTSLGWLKALKKSPVRRVFTRSVIWKFLNSDRSWFQAPDPA